MKYLISDETYLYDGSQLSSNWCYRNFGLIGDSIVGFCGPCQVEISNMVDLEDIRNNSIIFSYMMLHFIIEHFDLDLEKAILRQHLFMSIAKDIISEKSNAYLVRKGNDLFFENRKLSVSIATITPVSTIIHAGLNISSRDTPVPAIGLADLGITEKDTRVLAISICKKYAEEHLGILRARCKVRGVG